MRFTFIALLALVAAASANHDLFEGFRKSDDRLFEQKKIDVDSKALEVVEHTETIFAKPTYLISLVEVIDVEGKETSATPEVISGGQYNTYVTIKFTNQPGHGIHFLVKVYEYPNY